LADRLNAIDVVNIPQEGINKHPTIKLSLLATSDALDKLLDAYGWMIKEIKQTSEIHASA